MMINPRNCSSNFITLINIAIKTNTIPKVVLIIIMGMPAGDVSSYFRCQGSLPDPDPDLTEASTKTNSASCRLLRLGSRLLQSSAAPCGRHDRRVNSASSLVAADAAAVRGRGDAGHHSAATAPPQAFWVLPAAEGRESEEVGGCFCCRRCCCFPSGSSASSSNSSSIRDEMRCSEQIIKSPAAQPCPTPPPPAQEIRSRQQTSPTKPPTLLATPPMWWYSNRGIKIPFHHSKKQLTIMPRTNDLPPCFYINKI